jgi:hypothetical protein
LDWKLCDRIFSRPIWSSIWIRSDDWGWCHDLICGDIWIGTEDIGWSHDQIRSAICTGKDVTGSNHDKFEVQCDLEEMIEDKFMT